MHGMPWATTVSSPSRPQIWLLDRSFAATHPEAKTGAYVAVRITDTGGGIPSDIVGQIFEPFFTTKEVGKGTGIGLSTSLAIIKGHSGFIDVQSQAEKAPRSPCICPPQNHRTSFGTARWLPRYRWARAN